jgi:hypothetical protein
MRKIPIPKRKHTHNERVSFRTEHGRKSGIVMGFRLTGDSSSGWMWHYSIKSDNHTPGAHFFHVYDRDIL